MTGILRNGNDVRDVLGSWGIIRSTPTCSTTGAALCGNSPKIFKKNDSWSSYRKESSAYTACRVFGFESKIRLLTFPFPCVQSSFSTGTARKQSTITLVLVVGHPTLSATACEYSKGFSSRAQWHKPDPLCMMARLKRPEMREQCKALINHDQH